MRRVGVVLAVFTAVLCIVVWQAGDFTSPSVLQNQMTSESSRGSSQARHFSESAVEGTSSHTSQAQIPKTSVIATRAEDDPAGYESQVRNHLATIKGMAAGHVPQDKAKLLAYAQDSNQAIALGALKVLRNEHSKEAHDYFLNLLVSPDARVRRLALENLAFSPDLPVHEAARAHLRAISYESSELDAYGNGLGLAVAGDSWISQGDLLAMCRSLAGEKGLNVLGRNLAFSAVHGGKATLEDVKRSLDPVDPLISVNIQKQIELHVKATKRAEELSKPGGSPRLLGAVGHE